MNKKFGHKTFLSVFKGSLRQTNPLKSFTWLSENPIIESHERSDLLNLMALKGKWKNGVIRLNFDIGIRMEIEAVKQTLQNRNRTCGKPCQFGFGSQYAFYHYLNFFSEDSKFRFKYDDVFSSKFNLPSDFRLIFPDQDFWIEIKSVPPNMHNCRYYKKKTDPNPYPDYCICVRVLDEEMLNYELYGFCSGLDVQKVKPKLIHGTPCHEIPLTREFFIDYGIFHKKVLGLHYLERFDNEHYV